MSAYAGKFVPLKVTTDGNEDWAEWSQKYPNEGNAIPIVYVVTAAGEKLYAKSGSLPGENLKKLLDYSLQQAGRVLSDAEVATLQQTLADVEQAKGDLSRQAAAFARVAKIGPPGDLQSQSELAIQVDEQFKVFAEAAKSSIDQATANLTEQDRTFEAVLALVEAESAYAAFPELNAVT